MVTSWIWMLHICTILSWDTVFSMIDSVCTLHGIGTHVHRMAWVTRLTAPGATLASGVRVGSADCPTWCPAPSRRRSTISCFLSLWKTLPRYWCMHSFHFVKCRFQHAILGVHTSTTWGVMCFLKSYCYNSGHG